MKLALVCDWLTNFAGAERCILALHEIWPDAPIYTAIYNPSRMPQFKNAKIIPSFIQRLPFSKIKWQPYLFLMPIAFESFDLSEYDIVISTSHSCSKGIITRPRTIHICYCFSPMRYAWDYSQRYIAESNFPKPLKIFIPFLMNYIRVWDKAAADRVDKFIAISSYIKKRIKKYYGRDSEVIYPPVNCDFYQIKNEQENYFLIVSRLVPYKRVDIAIKAFLDLKFPLKIIGEGPDKKRLLKLAGSSSNIEFLGWLPDEKVREYYQKCLAFIFPQEEDFGITPLEAQACGRPVIAYKAGGALETILEGKTGIFFEEQTPQALKEAIKKFDPNSFDPLVIRNHALKFDVKIFKEKFRNLIEDIRRDYGI